jgi:hypothetical protein
VLPAGSYFISARSGDDFTFTLSDWDRASKAGASTCRPAARADNRIAATVFDRTLLRAGETVHMKHFLRRHTEQGIALYAPKRAARRRPAKLFIIHQGSERETELPLAWDANGTAEATGRFRRTPSRAGMR